MYKNQPAAMANSAAPLWAWVTEVVSIQIKERLILLQFECFRFSSE